jgi:hypothetical protein
MMETRMVDKLIISDDRFSLYLIPVNPSREWVNFRVISRSEEGRKFLRSRLAYNRSQLRFSESKSMRKFRDADPDALLHVKALIEQAIKNGAV